MSERKDEMLTLWTRPTIELKLECDQTGQRADLVQEAQATNGATDTESLGRSHNSNLIAV